MIHQKTRNDNENKYKELNEAKNMVVQSVKKMQIIQRREKTVDQKKALAQYQRQIAARITKGQAPNNIQLPESIIITNEVGQPIYLNEVDIVKNEREIMQEADRAIHGKHIIETLIHVIPHQHQRNKKSTRARGTIQTEVTTDRPEYQHGSTQERDHKTQQTRN